MPFFPFYGQCALITLFFFFLDYSQMCNFKKDLLHHFPLYPSESFVSHSVFAYHFVNISRDIQIPLNLQHLVNCKPTLWNKVGWATQCDFWAQKNVAVLNWDMLYAKLCIWFWRLKTKKMEQIIYLIVYWNGNILDVFG